MFDGAHFALDSGRPCEIADAREKLPEADQRYSVCHHGVASRFSDLHGDPSVVEDLGQGSDN